MRLTTDTGEFLAALGNVDPVLNAVLLEDAHAAPGGAQYLVVEGGGVMYSARRGINLGALPVECVAAAADALRPVASGAKKVEGLAAGAFAAEWSVAGGKKLDGIRLYRLKNLVEAEAPGQPRLAVEDDASLVARWIEDLAGPAGEWAEHQIEQRRLWLWEDGGMPVSLVARRAEVRGVVRLGPIYTPPNFRRRGYGAALTAHVSASLPGEVCLRTEVGNPFTQRIYESVGFEKAADFDRYALDPAVGAGDLD